MQVTKRFVFDSAHTIVGHPRCGEVHGHTWTLDVSLTGEMDDDSGMVVDFHILGAIVKDILSKYDHKMLNDVPGLPLPLTCETFVYHLMQEIKAKLIATQAGMFYKIECALQEGHGGWATISELFDFEAEEVSDGDL